MPNEVIEPLETRRKKLRGKIALYDGLAVLAKHADRVHGLTAVHLASPYFDKSEFVRPRQRPITDEFDQMSSIIKERTVALLSTIGMFGTMSWMLAPAPEAIPGSELGKIMGEAGTAPSRAFAFSNTIAENCVGRVIFGTFAFTRLKFQLRWDPALVDTANELWGGRNMSHAETVRRGIVQGTIAQLRKVKPRVLQGLLSMTVNEIIALRSRVENYVDQELLRYLNSQPVLPPEFRGFRNSELRRIWRNRILFEFWLERGGEAREFGRESRKENSKLEHAIRAASDQLYSIETWVTGRGKPVYKYSHADSSGLGLR